MRSRRRARGVDPKILFDTAADRLRAAARELHEIAVRESECPINNRNADATMAFCLADLRAADFHDAQATMYKALAG